MKANELRVGNWVLKRIDDFHPTEFTRIKIMPWDIQKIHFKEWHIEPLDLNDDWIQMFVRVGKIGKVGMNCYKFMENQNIKILGKHYYKLSFNDMVIIDDLIHVHQLQNLYFALTGEELDSEVV